SNPQTITGDKTAAHQATNSVTQGDEKVKKSPAPVSAIAHQITDTIPTVPQKCWNLSLKCGNLSPKCWNFETWLKRITPLFPESPVILI
ncbi:hypothetical protein V6O07_20750, partial [Arthrospira platensis SPKY2]